ncbi:MAG: hypothetical protein JWM04_35 [Verrucomicrobiales bacterium]|nr:hypothetical protein [Verrucomicrobiales bacterium]
MVAQNPDLWRELRFPLGQEGARGCATQGEYAPMRFMPIVWCTILGAFSGVDFLKRVELARISEEFKAVLCQLLHGPSTLFKVHKTNAWLYCDTVL